MPKMRNVLYIVMPAYNEEKNIVNTIESWYPVVEKYAGDGYSRLVIFNDGSKDHTYEVVKEMMHQMPLLEVVNKDNSGHGPTVIKAYQYAISHGADYVFQTDSDGQTNPDEFEQFWIKREEYSAIFGDRRIRGDGKQRAFVENVVCFLLRMYFGVKVPDANAPFRLMKTDVLKKYLDKLPEDYNLPNIMLTTYYKYYHERIQFIPISFQPRQAGKNSINFKRIFSIGWKALGDFRKLKKDMKNQM